MHSKDLSVSMLFGRCSFLKVKLLLGHLFSSSRLPYMCVFLTCKFFYMGYPLRIACQWCVESSVLESTMKGLYSPLSPSDHVVVASMHVTCVHVYMCVRACVRARVYVRIWVSMWMFASYLQIVLNGRSRENHTVLGAYQRQSFGEFDGWIFDFMSLIENDVVPFETVFAELLMRTEK